MNKLSVQFFGIGLCFLLLIPLFIERGAQFDQAIEQGYVITGMNYGDVEQLWGKPTYVCRAYKAPHFSWTYPLPYYWNYGAIYYKDRDITLVLSPVTYIVTAVLKGP